MSERALSPSPEEIHEHSLSTQSHRPQSPLSAGHHSPEQSFITDVFSDAFSLEPLDSVDTPLGHSGQSDHASSNSSTTLDDENGLSSYLSPFRDSVASFQSQMSQRSGSPEPEPISEREQAAPNHAPVVTQNAVSSSITRHSSSASSTTHPPPSVAHRSISVSSRFSMPRALSPYTGQTRPTHPYAMYPQATGLGRSSSISSISTVRPVERSQVEPMPPQHPYAMYPQNTVPEEEDVEVHSPIPVGFPGREQAFRSRGNAGANEVGDIVGADGHTEQLPPYTRYPDGTPQKFGAHEFVTPPPPVTLAGVPVSPESGVSSRTLLDEDGAGRQNAPAGEPQVDDPSGSIKEKLVEKGKTRVCCGLQIWTIILIAIVVLIGAVIGGVVGGVVGNKRGEKAGGASASSALSGGRPTSVFVTVTATTMLDAAQLTTTPSLLPIPTGDFQIPAASLHGSSNSCVNDDDLVKSWQCMNKGSFSCSLSEEDDGSKSIELQSYKRNGNFIYGAQAPALEVTTFDLKLMLDKTQPDLGPALFFFTPFDKLVIIHSDDFPHVLSGQPVDGVQLRRRAGTAAPMASKPGDRPYFCWWNSTYLELFIYVNQQLSEPTTTTGSGQYTPTKTSTTLTSTTALPSLDLRGLRTTSLAAPGGLPMEYPRMIKLEEIRSSTDGTPPYCEQMQVMDDGTISGPLGSRVPVDEAETTLSSSRSDGNGTLSAPDDDDDCFCQWIVG
ncbi:conserved hypothetical protein [Histoplasma capsulatum var. duboisii H88]|uniref:DUF7820 domain-containing protein n=1 Tax=Ajellomyces capsulatus (strain H88) TaxID=544711 RepID=F0U8V6_AJEC8|nr:conserved hypothetical protein [Histoplasma capsulatum var. duboisii H88]QSS52605.1 hypothetical protein I7I53_08299 [Histoplasma capsulatum var. duboisii H88]